MKIAGLVAAAAAALVLAGCGGEESLEAAPASAAPPSCPRAWSAGWQKLADDVGADVFCPTWMPQPLDGAIGGQFANGRWVDRDRSYLVSLVWFERGVGGIEAEVHVNFRGYPGSVAIPVCEDTLTVKGVTRHKKIPCFADPRGTRRIGGITARVYTVNQGIDQWHVLYAWRHEGSLYTVSQHVIAPYTYRRVVGNLDRLVAGLAIVAPTSHS